MHPVVRVRFPAQVERDTYEWLFQLYARLAAETHAPTGWLIELDAYDALGNTAAQRREAAEIFERYREAVALGTSCEARVVSRPLLRNILTAFDWITSSPWPRRNFGSIDEATAWIGSLRA